MKRVFSFLIYLFLIIFFVSGQKKQDPLIIKKLPYTYTMHGTEISDPYHWMEDLSSPDVLRYIKKNNKYVKNTLRKLKKFEKEFMKEYHSRYFISQPDPEILKNPNDTLTYYERDKGKSTLYCRKIRNGKEQIILDSRVDLKELSKNYEIEHYEISPDDRRVGYQINKNDVWYTDESFKSYLRIKFMGTLSGFEEQLVDVWQFVWMDDSTIIYSQYKQAENNQISGKVYRHVLGTPQNSDILLFDKNCTGYMLDIELSNSKKYLFIDIWNNFTSEYYYFDVFRNDTPKLIHPHENAHVYSLDHYGNDAFFYIKTTNKDAPNGRYVTADILNPEYTNWKDFVLESDAFILEKINMKKYLLLKQMKEQSIDLVVVNKSTRKIQPIFFDEPAHNVELIYIDTTEMRIRLRYNSYITPPVYYDYYLEVDKLNKVFATEVNDYKRDNYVVKILYAPSHDGKSIPITIIYNKFVVQKGIPAPIEMTVYGAYGNESRPRYWPELFSILDRGFYFAIPEIRGNGGRASVWHIEGSGMNKKNTGLDIVSLSRYLINERYTSSGNIYLTGRSAGGIAVGMAINKTSELFGGAKLFAASTDVFNDSDYMEWGDFGNPNIKEQFEYMLEYSPYQNVRHQAYPPLLFVHGYRDINVPCYTTTKMVARIREYRTNNNPIFMNIEFAAKHNNIFMGKTKLFHPWIFSLALHNQIL